MDFLEAVETSRQNNYKIRRNCWGSDTYLSIDEATAIIFDEKGNEPALRAGDVLATDWEVKMKSIFIQDAKVGQVVTYGLDKYVILRGTVYDGAIPLYDQKDMKFGYMSKGVKVQIPDV